MWSYYPRNVRPMPWALELVDVVASAKTSIYTEPLPSAEAEALTSDTVLKFLRPGMEALGYTVEAGKKADEKIRRPVLFGENGSPSVTYEIDAFHDALGIAVEVEAGRGAMGNAEYRDIVRTSLLLDARYMVLMLPLLYRYGHASKTLAYAKTRDLFNAIYASERLRLPFDGVLLIGY